jgi:hypothetical protein
VATDHGFDIVKRNSRPCESALWLDEPAPDGLSDGFGSGAGAELPACPVQVPAYGGLPHLQLPGDGRVGQPPSDKLQAFQLPGRQLRSPRILVVFHIQAPQENRHQPPQRTLSKLLGHSETRSGRRQVHIGPEPIPDKSQEIGCHQGPEWHSSDLFRQELNGWCRRRTGRPAARTVPGEVSVRRESVSGRCCKLGAITLGGKGLDAPNHLLQLRILPIRIGVTQEGE